MTITQLKNDQNGTTISKHCQKKATTWAKITKNSHKIIKKLPRHSQQKPKQSQNKYPKNAKKTKKPKTCQKCTKT